MIAAQFSWHSNVRMVCLVVGEWHVWLFWFYLHYLLHKPYMIDFCAWTENPLVNQCWVMASNTPPFDTWSNPCVSFAKWGKKCLSRQGLSSGPRHTASFCVALQCLHNVFSCGVAKDCITVRELGIETGVETNKGSRLVGWSAAIFAVASPLAFPRETESELLVWARHLQTAIEFGSKMEQRYAHWRVVTGNNYSCCFKKLKDWCYTIDGFLFKLILSLARSKVCFGVMTTGSQSLMRPTLYLRTAHSVSCRAVIAVGCSSDKKKKI